MTWIQTWAMELGQWAAAGWISVETLTAAMSELAEMAERRSM